MAKNKVVYLLVPVNDEGAGKKTYFNRAGVAFENKDGSLNVRLDLFPGITFQIRDVNGTGGNGSSQQQPELKGDKPF